MYVYHTYVNTSNTVITFCIQFGSLHLSFNTFWISYNLLATYILFTLLNSCIVL